MSQATRSVELAKIVVSTAASSTSIANHYKVYETSELTRFIASQIDAVVDLIKIAATKGKKATVQEVTLVLLKKNLTLTAFFNNDLVKCGGAIASISMSTFGLLAAAGPEATTGIGIPAVYVEALGLLSEYFDTEDACRPIQQAFVESGAGFLMQLNRAIYDWVNSQSMDVSMPAGASLFRE
jgi:hypothetical protein